MNRRGFFSRLVAVTATIPVVVAMPTSEPDMTGLAIDQVYCPKCFWVQPNPLLSTVDYDAERYVALMLAPHAIVCYNKDCRHPMTVTFARRR